MLPQHRRGHQGDADRAAQDRRVGRPSGGVADPLIAATALVHGCVMVTRNLRHFDAAEGLIVEHWFDDPAPLR